MAGGADGVMCFSERYCTIACAIEAKAQQVPGMCFG